MNEIESRLRALEMLMHHLLVSHSAIRRQLTLIAQALPGRDDIRRAIQEEGEVQAHLADEIAKLSSAVLLRKEPPAGE